MNSLVRGAAAVAVAALALVSGAASADVRVCEGRLAPISGKITTNAIGPGETLGVLAGTVDEQLKLKCGIQGKAFFNPDGTFGGFTHTLVCGDAISVFGQTVHSQVVAISRYDGMPDFTSCGIPGMDLQYGSFREITEPQSGRGIFSPTGGGRLEVDGTVNCVGAVDMKISGQVCLAY
ncbi:hypothetical protein LLG90_03525 [Aromatoleum toluclasticum]|uniref:hypothetical protein n=1 Tax=Aromatoleum toluclasticum TaxID=92003 RepID=UPI001D197DE9|nr:hypothetical protein [Aromatoleum toluclasticum]MCC4114417.1 hypothetical protein [Aromatoleum toluclasticum]